MFFASPSFQHLVLSAMKQHSYDFWEKTDPDPRGITAFSRKSYRVISTHCLLWVPVEGHTPMLIHLVVFYKRGSYLWHAVGQDNLHVPPYSLAESYFAKTPGSYSLLVKISLRIIAIIKIIINFFFFFFLLLRLIHPLLIFLFFPLLFILFLLFFFLLR